MKTYEFLKMMREDVETELNKETLLAVVDSFEMALEGISEIEPGEKTPQAFFEKMEEHAKANQKGNTFCFTPKLTKEFVCEFLGVDLQSNAKPKVDVDFDEFF